MMSISIYHFQINFGVFLRAIKMSAPPNDMSTTATGIQCCLMTSPVAGNEILPSSSNRSLKGHLYYLKIIHSPVPNDLIYQE